MTSHGRVTWQCHHVRYNAALAGGRTEFTWSGEVTGTPNGDAPNILAASFTFRAEVDIPQSGAEGMIVTQGGRFGGYGFYVLKGKPVFLYNFVDLKRTRWEGPELTPAKHTLEFDFKYDGLGIGTLAFNNVSGLARSGTGVLKVDGKEVARESMEHTIPLIMQWDENFDIGADTGTPVSNDYQVPLRFTGKIGKLTLKIDRPQLTPADVEKLKQATRNNRAAE
jgi:arylsulfatase